VFGGIVCRVREKYAEQKTLFVFFLFLGVEKFFLHVYFRCDKIFLLGLLPTERFGFLVYNTIPV